jgi:hypothetical protein
MPGTTGLKVAGGSTWGRCRSCWGYDVRRTAHRQLSGELAASAEDMVRRQWGSDVGGRASMRERESIQAGDVQLGSCIAIPALWICSAVN